LLSAVRRGFASHRRIALSVKTPKTWTNAYSGNGALVLLTLGAFAIGIWVISPRFSITGPSLIDDWNALLSAPAELHALIHLSYRVQGRFYPAWILWNWAQWRVPGAPNSMVGPNLLGVGRLASVVVGTTALTSVVVSGDRKHPVEWAILCTLPALIIVAVPGFGVDLARFGPQEPALVGGMMLGGTLLFVGGRDLGIYPLRHPIRAWLCMAVGSLAWCYGVFSKETSVCVLLAVPLVVVVLRKGSGGLGPRQRKVFAGVFLAALLPLLAMLYEVVRIVQRGSLEYGAHVKTGRGAISVFVHAMRVMSHQIMSTLGVVVLGVVLVAVVVGPLSRRHRLDWLLLTILIVALAALEMSVQTEYYESRYYLPSFALLAVGAARGVQMLPVRYLRFVVVGACVFAIVSATMAHAQVRRWATADQQGDVVVSAVRVATKDGCRLSIAGVDPERTLSIAALVRYGRGQVDCSAAERHVLLGPLTNETPQAACAPAGATIVGTWPFLGTDQVVLVRCAPS
jgi:hypothetical protein